MKTIKQVIIVCSMLLNVSLFANNGEELIKKEVSSKLKKSVIMPESLKDRQGSHRVTVSFVVNENGRVTEVFVNTKDKEAKKDIENQFLQLSFNELSPCVRHSIDINFLFL